MGVVRQVSSDRGWPSSMGGRLGLEFSLNGSEASVNHTDTESEHSEAQARLDVPRSTTELTTIFKCRQPLGEFELPREGVNIAVTRSGPVYKTQNMPAYVNTTAQNLIQSNVTTLVGQLELAYSRDGFSTQYTSQTRAWKDSIPLLIKEISFVLDRRPEAQEWIVLLEFPLYRLRKRIDVVILTESVIVPIELKVGAAEFLSTDRRQVEEYALDLFDFHDGSHDQTLLPCLWCTEAPSATRYSQVLQRQVCNVHNLGQNDLGPLLLGIQPQYSPSFVRDHWDDAQYKPVPTIIEAATSIFSGHDVREIAKADASNLTSTVETVLQLVERTKTGGKHSIIVVTGVPGSGKTLAGLQVVHDAIATGSEQRGEIVYLSGNTPLVVVLRESLARDEHRRDRENGIASNLTGKRRSVRTRIQHIIDFLRDSLLPNGEAPHEHVIVFDEAQRAWNEKQGWEKFERDSSEPLLLMQIMSRHHDWSSIVCLVGGGQEINTGENGISGWGEALRTEEGKKWTVFAPRNIISGDITTGELGLGDVPKMIEVITNDSLALRVPIRSYRSRFLSDWVHKILVADQPAAAKFMAQIKKYPIVVTRSKTIMRDWLKENCRGKRRFGLVASSAARRLRAEGLGVSLRATDGLKISQWYLNEPGDIRSSFALEVTANEYTSQGLELDFVGLCWGGDLVYDPDVENWRFRRLNGNLWQNVAQTNRIRFIRNSYRVLLTRAREGIVIWIPAGCSEDETRNPLHYDSTAEFLIRCGATLLE